MSYEINLWKFFGLATAWLTLYALIAPYPGGLPLMKFFGFFFMAMTSSILLSIEEEKRS